MAAIADATTTKRTTSTIRRARVIIPASRTPSGARRLLSLDDRQLDEARLPGRVVDPLGRLPIVLRLRPEDAGHERLRIAVVEREPARLDLHHHAMPGPEHVVRVGQGEAVGEWLAGGDRRRRL